MNTRGLQFYSHGKLLITGEYLVMYGAQSLAIPVKFGQHFHIKAGEHGILKWEAFIQNKPWFSASFRLPQVELIDTTDSGKSEYLGKVLFAAKLLNPGFLNNNNGYTITTQLEYPQEWGLGSSSTFISNLAWWAGVDPFKLNQRVTSGSGYDIACARSEYPIIYHLEKGAPVWEPVAFSPSYIQNLFLLYLGQKQNTAGSVSDFRGQYCFNNSDIDFINELTQQLVMSRKLDTTIHILKEHENYMGKILKMEPIKQKYFHDFDGEIKSLGAWGGDFALVASNLSLEEVKIYFRSHGFLTLLKFEELMLNKPIIS